MWFSCVTFSLRRRLMIEMNELRRNGKKNFAHQILLKTKKLKASFISLHRIKCFSYYSNCKDYCSLSHIMRFATNYFFLLLVFLETTIQKNCPFHLSKLLQKFNFFFSYHRIFHAHATCTNGNKKFLAASDFLIQFFVFRPRFHEFFWYIFLYFEETFACQIFFNHNFS